MRVLGACVFFSAALIGGAAGADDGGPRALAARIDARLADAWAKAGVHPSARADDGEFLRRASLDLVGRIPTAAEARDFLDDPDANKRPALVDRLLASPAYAERATLLWRQLLLPDSGDQVFFANSGGFEAWLRKKVVEEASYDRIVREILGAKLSARDNDPTALTRQDPSPAAYYAAKGGKPETLAADSARAFLGIRLECAQCHNHPFAKWKSRGILGVRRLLRRASRSQADDADAVAVTRDPDARGPRIVAS